MITWIQNRLIKNGRWLFLILLGVVIVAFVFVIGETPGLPGTERGMGARQEFYGYNLASPDQRQMIDREATIVSWLNTGSMDFPAETMRNLALARIALLDIADRLAIPEPSSAQIREFILELPAFQDEQGQFDRSLYQEFIDSLANHPFFPRRLVEKAIRDEYRISVVSRLLRGPSYLSPFEVLRLAQRNEASWSTRVARINMDDFQPQISLSDDQLRAYYEQNAFQFEISSRRHVSWIHFSRSAFYDQIETPSDEELLTYIEENISRYLEPMRRVRQEQVPVEAQDPEGEDPAAEPGESQAEEDLYLPEPIEILEVLGERVIRDWKDLRAGPIARREASDFAYRIYDRDLTKGSLEFEQSIEEKGLPTGSLNPIAPASAPADAGEGVNREILQAIQDLNPRQFFTDALRFRDGYAVFYLTRIDPPKIPAFEDIRDEVAIRYHDTERRRRFSEAGRWYARMIRQQLEAGLGFEEAIDLSRLTEADLTAAPFEPSMIEHLLSIPIETQSYRGYSLMNPPEDMPRAALEATVRLREGELTEMIRSGRWGMFVWVENREVPEIDLEGAAYLEARERLQWANQELLMRNFVNEYVARGSPPDLR